MFQTLSARHLSATIITQNSLTQAVQGTAYVIGALRAGAVELRDRECNRSLYRCVQCHDDLSTSLWLQSGCIRLAKLMRCLTQPNRVP